jgi:acyl carrier protein phosphodiesterase
MNYLAHSLLSFDQEHLLIGNFIADHIKLNKTAGLPESIKQGVLLHRKIDHFTDTHPLFIKSKRFFYEGYERYSGVLLDIYYDHILAANFEKFSDVPLKDYVAKVYDVLKNNTTHLPDSSQRFLEYAIQNNTFFEYSKKDGIKRVLSHLSYRINHGIDLSGSFPLFEKNYEQIEADFFPFMQEITAHLKKEVLFQD